MPPAPIRGVLPSLEAFGTEEYFLRPSQLKKLVHCNMLALLEATEDVVDAGGAAAQIGSVTHEAVAAFHKETNRNEKVEAGFAALLQALPKFPLADANEAKLYFTHYSADPRNLNAELHAIEHPVKLTLPPHRSDPTGQDIIIRGTLDQIRVWENRLVVMDYKTGSKSTVFQMLNEYCYQLAAYYLAARESGFPVDAAFLIRGYTYRERSALLPSPSGVFIEMPLTEKRCYILLERVQAEVARIRSGEAQFGVGANCQWCPMGGYQNCIDKAGQRFEFET